MARVHLVLGPVGAGKSTFAFQLANEHEAVRFTLDEWMATLYGDDERPADRMAWYVERTERCLEQIWRVATDVLAVGRDVVLEVGLIQRAPRQAFLQRIDDADGTLTMYVVDAPREVRRERVLRRNEAQGATFSVVVPPEIFELASDLWEAPDDGECAGRDVVFV